MSGLRERLEACLREQRACLEAIDAIVAEFDPPWTTVEDGLPEIGVDVWTHGSGGRIAPGHRSIFDGEWYSTEGSFLGGVTHWKPARIPAPPERE